MSEGHSTYTPKTGIERWFDARMPLPRMVYDSFIAYPVPWLHRGGRLGGLLDLLDERRTRERGVYRERALRRLVEAYRQPQLPERHWHVILWQVAVFELFCRRFVDAEPIGAASAAARASA